jgi:LysM repeat protein
MGVTERGAVSRALIERPRTVRFGRGTAVHLQALASQPEPAPVAAPGSPRRSWNPLRALLQPQVRWSRRLAATGLAAMLISSVLQGAAMAQEAPVPTVASRYIVQPGDTPESIASIFDVPADAILSASTLLNPPYLTANEVVVIPGVGEDAELTRWSGAAEWAPYVVSAHVVAPGETLADIATAYKIDPGFSPSSTASAISTRSTKANACASRSRIP